MDALTMISFSISIKLEIRSIESSLHARPKLCNLRTEYSLSRSSLVLSPAATALHINATNNSPSPRSAYGDNGPLNGYRKISIRNNQYESKYDILTVQCHQLNPKKKKIVLINSIL